MMLIVSKIPQNPKVTVIVHGFKTGRLFSFLKVKDGLLNLPDSTYRPDVVIVVDWRPMAILNRNSKDLGYALAAKHAKEVGMEVAYLLEVLRKRRGLSGDNVHLIGFSLGAHVSSNASRIATKYYQVSKIGRITGLDPADPMFDDLELTLEDAKFVDVIHTNAGDLLFGKFGTHKSMGHVDFFPNGGARQPPCTRFPRTAQELACSHNMATDYFEASLSSDCQFIGYKYDRNKWPYFMNRPRKNYTNSETARMGFYAYDSQARGNFYLKTTSTYPYC